MSYRFTDEEPKDLKYFQSKYEAHIEDSREYKQYTRQMPYYMWDGKRPMDVETQVVPMKAVHLSNEHLERLINDFIRSERWRDEAEYAKSVLSMLRRDEQVRDNNPAVQKAYKNYIMLLELARK